MASSVRSRSDRMLLVRGDCPAGARFVVEIDGTRSPVSSYDVDMMIEIVPGISVDSERVFGKPVISGSNARRRHGSRPGRSSPSRVGSLCDMRLMPVGLWFYRVQIVDP